MSESMQIWIFDQEKGGRGVLYFCGVVSDSDFLQCSLRCVFCILIQSRMLLQPELVLEDVSQDHARKTVRFMVLVRYFI